LGLSVGTTQLAAVTRDRSLVRRPTITMPSGVVITDFVDRVGDPVGIVAADGSVHAAQTLLVDALRDLAQAAIGGSIPPTTAISYPAHWRRSAVEALRQVLRTWPGGAPILIPDTSAQLAAVRAGSGLPNRGVIALLDLGGGGTNITLIDAANGDQPIAPTQRHDEFCGDLIDQALLAHVVAGAGVDTTGTSALGSLTDLRAQCRAAKERLSAGAVTSLPGDVRITRPELDEIVSEPLAALIDALEEMLSHAGVSLAAVATVGGGASIPVVTTALSERLRVPVVTAPRPELAAAIGVALISSRPAPRPVPVPVPAPAKPAEPVSERIPVLAWSTAPEVPAVSPAVRQKPTRPQIDFQSDRPEVVDDDAPLTWYRRPLPVVAAALIVIAMAGAGTVLALRSNTNTTVPAPSAHVPSVTVTNAPDAAQPVQAVQAPAAEVPAAPAPQTYVQVPAPVTRTQMVQAPMPAPQAPAPEAPAAETGPAAPIPTVQIPAIPLIPAIPAIPQIPGLRFELPMP
jgi:actin-like ATPase involved in cell morphogenesis